MERFTANIPRMRPLEAREYDKDGREIHRRKDEGRVDFDWATTERLIVL